ncbi:hypothetical protein GCM10027413_31810 [Conyzicola nivalis]|uniref:Uncharacterized protein n=1 Tax=Conyzicola nivalis TaxID=1477021 RepID=A0A916SQP6_9MICO|nr:tripartite tricarboxylate transporter TctB family protein [Conyzicola nivalis]GGB11851.1 hypothetical protein GCM10010979_27710 [Conyzicola nivalis]
MADKTDEPNTPTGENTADNATGETPSARTGETPVGDTASYDSPVYDSLVDTGEPVVATVDEDPKTTEYSTPPAEQDEIVVEEAEYAPEEPLAQRDTAVVDEAPREAPYVAPVTPAAAAAAAPAPSQPNVVYVNKPQEPVEKNNRGFGVLISLAATIVFLVVLAIVMVIIYSSRSNALFIDFLGQTAFYVPALFFLVGSVVLALLLNRAGWWAHVIGSLLVALFVYFGTIATVLVVNGVVLLTPSEAAEQFRLGTVSPFTIAAALVAREVAIWAGAIIASRGRKLKARNAEALETFQREQAQTRGY